MSTEALVTFFHITVLEFQGGYFLSWPTDAYANYRLKLKQKKMPPYCSSGVIQVSRSFGIAIWLKMT